MISLRKGCSALAVATALLTSACSDSETTTAPLTPSKLEVVGPTSVTAEAGFPAPQLLRVRLTTKSGAPVSRAVVHFTVTSGATLSNDSSFTDENGEAAVGVTLGPAGDYTITASSAGVAAVTMTATARAPIATSLFKGFGDAQAGFANEAVAPISVVVLDQSGVPAVGVPVTFTVTAGGGSVSPVPAITDNTGTAVATFTLGSSGTQSVSASVPGLTTVGFTATFANPCVSGRPITLPFALNRALDAVDCLLPSGKFIEYFDMTVSTAFKVTQASSAFQPMLIMLKGVDTVAIMTAAGSVGYKTYFSAGNYRFAATSSLAAQTGAYTLTSATISEVGACEPAWIMQGANSGAQNIAATDCQLTYNDGNGFGSQLHYGDAYFIYLKASQAISIVQSGAADHFIRVFNPSGTLVATRDNFIKGSTETLAFTATVAGVYRIEAATFNNNAGGVPPDVGGYTLTIN